MRNRIFQLLLFFFICFPIFSQGNRGGSVDNVTKTMQKKVGSAKPNYSGGERRN